MNMLNTRMIVAQVVGVYPVTGGLLVGTPALKGLTTCNYVI